MFEGSDSITKGCSLHFYRGRRGMGKDRQSEQLYQELENTCPVILSYQVLSTALITRECWFSSPAREVCSLCLLRPQLLKSCLLPEGASPHFIIVHIISTFLQPSSLQLQLYWALISHLVTYHCCFSVYGSLVLDFISGTVKINILFNMAVAT